MNQLLEERFYKATEDWGWEKNTKVIANRLLSL